MPGRGYEITEELEKQIMEELVQNVRGANEIAKKAIWVTATEQEKIDREDTNRKKQIQDIFEFEKSRIAPDPVDILRREMQDELRDIKKAIHTIGILLDGDKPGDEILEKHKTLRDAYRKYKMIEALILGQQ